LLAEQYDYPDLAPDTGMNGQPTGQIQVGATTFDTNGRGHAADGKFVTTSNDAPNTPASHPASLLASAKQWGIDNAEQLSATDLREAIRDAKLDRALSFQQTGERQAVHDALGNRGQDTAPNGSAQPGVAPATPGGNGQQPTQTQPTAPAIDWGTNSDGTPLTEADWPKPAAAAFKLAAQVPLLLERIAKLESSHNEVAGVVRDQHARQTMGDIDQGFADAGPEYAAILGTGQSRALPKDSPLLNIRRQIVASLQASPIKDVPIKQAIAQRTKELYGHLAALLGGQQPAAQPGAPNAPQLNRPLDVHPGQTPAVTEEQWRNATTTAPTGRKVAPPKGTAAAVAAVSQYLKDHDMGSEADPAMPE
jgi:hypothetical protein